MQKHIWNALHIMSIMLKKMTKIVIKNTNIVKISHVYPPNSVKHLIDKMNNSTSAGVECDKKCKNNSPDLSAHIPPHFNINEIYVEFTEKMDECKHKLISTKCCVYSLLDVDDNEVIGIIGINTFHDLDEKTIPCLCDIVPFYRHATNVQYSIDGHCK